jgi:hypothetical protein
MIYVSYGVPKSASTFTYIVTETVLKAAGYALAALSETAKGGKSRLNYIDVVSWSAIERVMCEIGEKSAVIKTHGAPDKRLMEAIVRGEIFASAVIRDPREIALSLMDHAKRSRSLHILDFAKIETVSDTFRVLDDVIKRLAKWMESGRVLLLTYEEISFDTESAVRRIIDQVGVSIAPATVIAALPDQRKIEQFNKGVRKRYETEMPTETQQLFLERYSDFYRRYLGQEPLGKTHDSGQGAMSAPNSNAVPSLAIGVAVKEVPRVTTLPGVEDILPQLVRALYRVLLFREPDAIGLNAYVQRMQAGGPIEDIMRQFLKSQEFAGKHRRFLETYISFAPSEPSQQDQPKTAPTGAASGSLGALEWDDAASKSASEHVIFVHSHRRSGAHFLLDTIRAWFDVREQIQAIPNPAVAPGYAPNSLSKDHEPFRGYELAQSHAWGSREQQCRGRHLYESGAHMYIFRNPLQVLRSAYVFDVSGAEPKSKIDPKTSFFEYLTATSLHEGNGGLSRLDYWVTHVKAWYFDEDTLSVHYEELKTNLADTLSAISDHIGLPVRQSPRAVISTGVGTNLTQAFLAEGQNICWDANVIDAVRSAVERILGPKPWRGLERYVADWLSRPP